jgi:large subunit ribosomal protein L10
LTEKLKNSPNFFLFDFDSAPHKKMEEMRIALYEKTARVQVVKNRLFNIALRNIKRQEVGERDSLVGSSAVVTMGDEWTEVLSSFFKFAKADEAFAFKAGVIDGVFYSKEGLIKLAQLPSRLDLIAKIISSFKSPQTRVVRAMNFNTGRLINVLKQASQKN